MLDQGGKSIILAHVARGRRGPGGQHVVTHTEGLGQPAAVGRGRGAQHYQVLDVTESALVVEFVDIPFQGMRPPGNLLLDGGWKGWAVDENPVLADLGQLDRDDSLKEVAVIVPVFVGGLALLLVDVYEIEPEDKVAAQGIVRLSRYFISIGQDAASIAPFGLGALLGKLPLAVQCQLIGCVQLVDRRPPSNFRHRAATTGH